MQLHCSSAPQDGFVPELDPSLPAEGLGESVSVPRPKPVALVIRRDHVARELLCHALRLEGIEVVATESSAKGMELFHAGPQQFDLVVLDRGLRTPAALQCLKDIRRSRPEIAAIMTTPRHKAASITSSDLTATLVEPFTAEDVVELARSLLG